MWCLKGVQEPSGRVEVDLGQTQNGQPAESKNGPSIRLEGPLFLNRSFVDSYCIEPCLNRFLFLAALPVKICSRLYNGVTGIHEIGEGGEISG